jgi:hypothetical protein
MSADNNENIHIKSAVVLGLGVLSIFLEEWFGLFLGIIGIVLYMKSKQEIAQQQALSKGMGIVGFICSIAGAVIQFLDIID